VFHHPAYTTILLSLLSTPLRRKTSNSEMRRPNFHFHLVLARGVP